MTGHMQIESKFTKLARCAFTAAAAFGVSGFSPHLSAKATVCMALADTGVQT